MNEHYERKWEVIEEVEFELFDRNEVRIEWLERDGYSDYEYPQQIRIHTTAYSNPRRMKRFRKLRGGRDYGSGWEPVIMATIVQIAEDLRSSPFDTFDDFIISLFICFRELWNDTPGFPTRLPEEGVEIETDEPETAASPLNEFYVHEAIEEAASMMIHGHDGMSFDRDQFEMWGDQSQETGDDLPEDDYEAPQINVQ